MTSTLRLRVPPPIIRRLRVFAIDPGMTARFETAVLNEMTLEIPWEKLAAGPVGEYLAVVDENETGQRVHEPVDLDRLDILAQDGLPPSDGNPQFRQQMVYAVAMRTLRNFERALGRVVHWAPRVAPPHGPGAGKPGTPTYERRLRLYPRLKTRTWNSRRAFASATFSARRTRRCRARRCTRASRRTSSRMN
jgi:hypothetical protein